MDSEEAVVVPLIAFTALVVYRYAKAEQVRLEQEAVRIAGQTGLLVEAELKQLSAKLEGLASSAALARGDGLSSFFSAAATDLTCSRSQRAALEAWVRSCQSW